MVDIVVPRADLRQKIMTILQLLMLPREGSKPRRKANGHAAED
jgi:hypothetical protein